MQHFTFCQFTQGFQSGCLPLLPELGKATLLMAFLRGTNKKINNKGQPTWCSLALFFGASLFEVARATMMIRFPWLLLLSLIAQKAALACLPCGKDGVFITGINSMSSQRVLAANIAFYYSFDEFTNTGPLNPFNGIIDIETGLISEGHPSGVDIYPSSLIRSEIPTNFWT
jgi:hypothetical protein